MFQVLELAANKIKSLSGLKGDNLSSLLHLGLSHNEVSSIPPRSLTASRWYEHSLFVCLSVRPSVGSYE